MTDFEVRPVRPPKYTVRHFMRDVVLVLAQLRDLLRLILVQFKVVFILLLFFCTYETHSMIQWFYVNHTTMSAEGAAGFFSIILFLLGNLKWAMEKTMD